jgi:hypothetical protein
MCRQDSVFTIKAKALESVIFGIYELVSIQKNPSAEIIHSKGKKVILPFEQNLAPIRNGKSI